MAETLGVQVHMYPLAPGASSEALGWTGGPVTGHVMKAPAAARGGAITILRASVVNAAATGAGTGFALQLENWGTAGDAIKSGAGGTVGAAIGGTGDPWVANTPKQFTLDTANGYNKLAADEWLVLRKTETNSSDPTRAVLVIEYLPGA